MRRFNLFWSICLVAFAFLLVVGGCANTKSCIKEEIPFWLSPDSVVCSHLGDSVMEVLFMPDSIVCYVLEHKDSIGQSERASIEGYARNGLVAKLDAAAGAVLQYILISNPRSYATDSVKIEAPYLPIVEFAFERKDCIPVCVVVSMSDRSWTVVSDGKRHFRYNYADWRVVERFCQGYINEHFKAKEQ